MLGDSDADTIRALSTVGVHGHGGLLGNNIPTPACEMRKLIVHIGCAKGGSSAIQGALRLNRAKLASRGIVVPSRDLDPESEVTGSHAVFFESCVRQRRATPIPGLGDLLESAADAGAASTVVLSAENLSNPQGFEKLFEDLVDRFDISIVIYVRRQDEFLEASWQQWDVKLGGSLLAWTIRNVGRRGDWSSTVEPWARAFGDEHIIARVHDRSRLVLGDSFLDFCDVLGQDPTEFDAAGTANPGLTPMLSRMVEGNVGLLDGPHDQDFYDSVREVAPDLVTKTRSAPGLFSPDESKAIMAAYARSNERFRKRYLPNIKRPLFPMDRPNQQTPQPPQDVFERQLLQRQLLDLQKRVEELSRSSRFRFSVGRLSFGIELPRRRPRNLKPRS